MAYNLQDQEQIDELKAFWANNGNRLMWLAVIALAVFAGWRAWNWYHDGQAQDQQHGNQDRHGRLRRAGDPP